MRPARGSTRAARRPRSGLRDAQGSGPARAGGLRPRAGLHGRQRLHPSRGPCR